MLSSRLIPLFRIFADLVAVVIATLKHMIVLIVVLARVLVEEITFKVQLLLRGEQQRYKGIKIIGDRHFISATERALNRLEGTVHFETIRSNLRVIRQGRHSAIRVGVKRPASKIMSKMWDYLPIWYAPRPIYTVGRRWDSSSVWYASCIAHQAYHNVLFVNAGLRDRLFPTWFSPNGEEKCYKFQLQVLEDLGVEQERLEFFREWPQRLVSQSSAWRYIDFMKTMTRLH